MSRRVMRRVAPEEGKDTVDYLKIDDENGSLDWTGLPDDTVIQIFSCLNYRDRASLSSTCKPWQAVGRAPCLWQDLDLRFHKKFNWKCTSSLTSRCEKLEKIRFWGRESAEAIINLQAKNLKHIAGDYCGDMTDVTLCVLAARHASLQSLQIGPFREKITSNAIKAVAMCCPNLRKLWLSGASKLDAHAINALAEHCICLAEIGFTHCDDPVDESALGNVKSLRFLSLECVSGVNCATAAQHWAKLPHLVGLHVSTTIVNIAQLFDLYSSLPNLNVLCALGYGLMEDSTFVSAFNHEGKVLLSDVTMILKVLAALFVDNPEDDDFNVFLRWRDLKVKDKKFDGMLNWLERVISRSLLDMSESGWGDLLISQSTGMLLSFLQSSDEDVQEQAATSLRLSLIEDPEFGIINAEKAQAVMRQGGIPLLLNLATSWREGLQSEAVAAIVTLSEDGKVAEAVANEGGIAILTNLVRSAQSVAEKAAWGLLNLSFLDVHKGAIAEAGGVKALVHLIFRCSGSSDRHYVLKCCAWALANLASSDECRKEIASSVCGVNALAMLVKTCKFIHVKIQAARALAILAAHGYITSIANPARF